MHVPHVMFRSENIQIYLKKTTYLFGVVLQVIQTICSWVKFTIPEETSTREHPLLHCCTVYVCVKVYPFFDGFLDSSCAGVVAMRKFGGGHLQKGIKQKMSERCII